MGYLKDTCVLIKDINSGDKILNIASYCKSKGKYFCVTDIVMDELIPGRKLSLSATENSTSIIKGLEVGVLAKLIKRLDVTKTDVYKKNFDEIRKRYYGHLKDRDYIKQMIDAGEIKIEDVRSKNFQYKDFGECSCIAVAMCDPQMYVIVSNDKGRIFLKPKTNLFEKYGKSHGIRVLNYSEWVAETGYRKNNVAKSS